MTNKSGPAVIRFEGAISTIRRSKTDIKSFNSRKRDSTYKAESWGYETKKRKFPIWILAAIFAVIIILAALAVSIFMWFKAGS